MFGFCGLGGCRVEWHVIPREQRTMEGEKCIDVRVEDAVEREAVRRKERRASSVGGGRVLLVV